MLSGATFHDCINTIYQFIKHFLDNKMSIFEDYGAFNLCTFREQIHFKGRQLFQNCITSLLKRGPLKGKNLVPFQKLFNVHESKQNVTKDLPFKDGGKLLRQSCGIAIDDRL